MPEHPNVTLVRTMMEAMDTGDIATLADKISDGIVWHEIGNPEPVRGKEALAARFASADETWGEITGSVHDIVGNDDHVIALVEAQVTRGDKFLSYRTAEIFHVRDGKIAERWAFSDDTATIADFFA
jgi:ketosteroid isomerase-like protein